MFSDSFINEYDPPQYCTQVKSQKMTFFLSEEIIFPGELSEPSGSVVRIGIVNNRHSSTCRQEQARMTVQGMRYFLLMVVTCSWSFVPPLPW